MSNSHATSVSEDRPGCGDRRRVVKKPRSTRRSISGAVVGAIQSNAAVGYARLFAAEGGADLERQRRSIRAEARRRGWQLTWSFDTSERRETLRRSGMSRALRFLDSGCCGALIVADLERITRSLSDLSNLFKLSAEQGWVVISLGATPLDTTRSDGKLLRSVLTTYDRLADRDEDEGTTDEEGLAVGGSEPSLRERIVWERIKGASLGQIANGLNRDGIPPPDSSTHWMSSTVWAHLEDLRPSGGS